MQNKKFVLVDGSSYLFRAYHALPPLTSSKGVPTGALYGVASMLKKLIAEEKPDYFAVIFDTKAKNFRHALYPEYKANRAVMPDELGVQIAPLFDIIRAMGLPLIAIEGFEADDVIATLSHQASLQNLPTLISTGDKDLAQLVDEHVTLVNTMSGTRLDTANVITKFGVRPDQIIDYLSLIGDSVDNIPGIPKVGPKTAAKWLEQYGTLENLVSHAQEIKGKVGDYFREHLDKLPLYQNLVTVKRDVLLDFEPLDLIIQPADNEKLKNLLREFEFKSWLKEVEQLSKKDEVIAPLEEKKQRQFDIIFKEEELLQWCERIQQAKVFIFDSETTSLDPFQAKLVGISFATAKGCSAYVPFGHNYLGCPTQLSQEKVLSILKPLFEDPQIGKVGQNIKYDMHVLACHGIFLNNVLDDTMLLSYVLNSTATRHNLESLSQFYLRTQTISYEEITGKGAKKLSFDAIDIQRAAEYATEDADLTLQLKGVLSEKLAQESTLDVVYRDIELPLIDVLFQMEQHGVCIDQDKLLHQSEQIAQELDILEKEAYILAGKPFNLNSPKQLQEILFDELKLPIVEKTPKGVPSTGESALQALSDDYELPKIILKHRTLSKLKSTYTDKLPLQVNARTNRIHTCYNQAVAATGRLSSTEPNLQNIPIKTLEGRKIRQAFVPAPEQVFIAADYSQIELRIMAHLSQDPGLLKAFCLGEDIHRFTASEVLQITLAEVTAEQRRSAKAVNFGLIYGMSAFGLAKQLDIDRASAQRYMDQYFARYPGVKQYMESVRKKAEEQGYVETIFGRRLYLPDILSKNIARKRAAERMAINAPMQGSAADIIKKAMIALHQQLKGRTDIKMLLQVHDELVFEVKEQAVSQATEIIKECMQNTVKLSVPLIVDIGVGKNWDEAH